MLLLVILKNEKTEFKDRELFLNKGWEYKFPVSCFNLSRLEYYKKNDEVALKYLKRALENGFTDWRSIETSGEFNHVRESVEFKGMVNQYLLNGIR